MHTVHCEVCGKTATKRKKNKRFCSVECRGVGHKPTNEMVDKAALKNRGREWGIEQKKAHAKAVNKPSYKKHMAAIKTGIPMPIDATNGAGENNKNAKYWWFIKDGVHYKFKSLNRFVRENKHLFTEDELTEYKSENRVTPVYRATVMLRNLHLLNSKGEPMVPSLKWHGWTIGEKWEQGFYDD